MAFTPYYPGGWQSGEEGGTPITPDALNHYDDAFDDVYDAIQQSTADNTWTTTTLAGYAYGDLFATKNAFLKLVILRWMGNSTRPTEATVSVNLPAGLIPARGQIAPLKGGDSIEARTDGTIRINFTSTPSAWSGGQVVYYTST